MHETSLFIMRAQKKIARQFFLIEERKLASQLGFGQFKHLEMLRRVGHIGLVQNYAVVARVVFDEFKKRRAVGVAESFKKACKCFSHHAKDASIVNIISQKAWHPFERLCDHNY